jgi:glycosyltransferase involved in cell wall biosynthesis
MSLSFVLPAFNEADNIEASIGRCVQVGEQLGLEFEVIVVDDGSVDETRERADAVARRDGRVRTLHHPKNRGYGSALKSGLFAARMDKVFFTDADLQFDVAEIGRLLKYADRYGIVAGYRHPRRDPVGRVVLGWGWGRLVGWVFDMVIRDVDCAFKVFDRRIFDRIAIHSIGAFVNTEILVRARAEGFDIKQVPVSHYPRQCGEQSGANAKVILKAVTELAKLRGELKAIRRSSVREPVRL